MGITQKLIYCVILGNEAYENRKGRRDDGNKLRSGAKT